MKKQKAVAACLFPLIIASYTTCLIFLSLPDNPLYVELDIEPDSIPKIFRQEWTLFAPNPIKNSYRIIIHCADGSILDPISDVIASHEGIEFFSKKYYVYMGLTDFLFEGLSKKSAELCKEENVCSLATYSYRRSNEFLSFKNTLKQFCPSGIKNGSNEIGIEFKEIKYPLYSRAKLIHSTNRIMFND